MKLRNIYPAFISPSSPAKPPCIVDLTRINHLLSFFNGILSPSLYNTIKWLKPKWLSTSFFLLIKNAVYECLTDISQQLKISTIFNCVFSDKVTCADLLRQEEEKNIPCNRYFATWFCRNNEDARDSSPCFCNLDFCRGWSTAA